MNDGPVATESEVSGSPIQPRMIRPAERPVRDRLVEIDVGDHHPVQRDPDPTTLDPDLLVIP